MGPKGFIEFLNRLRIFGLEAFSLFYSSYRGIVIDNNDPNKTGKIQVIVPSVTGPGNHPIWATPKNQYSGKDYGLYNIPEIGSMVWVSFDKGNSKYPIWEHGHFGKDELPEEFDSIKKRGFKTQSGHLILFNDIKDVEEIIIKHANKKSTISIGKSGVTINCEDDTDIELKAGESIIQLNDAGVNIDAGSNEINIGGNYEVLYNKIPGSAAIADVSQIGISQKVTVGGI